MMLNVDASRTFNGYVMSLIMAIGVATLLTAVVAVGCPKLTHTEKNVKDDPFLYDTFPDGFLWGAATSAFQIEGGWNADGKRENIWDRWCHQGGHVNNNETGDVACNSYSLYKQDIGNLRNLGVNFYRFSISWSRILPGGKLAAGINEAGVAYYNNLIDGLLAAGIEPFVTLYHWDLPQPLQDDGGGWLNPDIVQHFNDYATVCFQRFGDRVKRWLTFNEPYVMTRSAYGLGIFPPGIKSPDTGVYVVAHNVIKAHAAAWHTYDSVFRPLYGGQISITLDGQWGEPLDPNNRKDVEAAERWLQFEIGWFAHPIFINGDYPDVMKHKIAEKSASDNLKHSRLPEFNYDEKKFIRGTYDFFGLNHYTTVLIAHKDHSNMNSFNWNVDRDVEISVNMSWPPTGYSFMREAPWGFRKLLRWIRDNYGNPIVYITENGASDDDEHFGKLHDGQRIRYLAGYINNVLKAIKMDSCNVAGYTVWSLMDNFEWTFGYSKTFGLYHVDFSDPERRRTAKDSVDFYKQLIANNGWPQNKL